jgi:hypothetical protein
VANQPGGYSGTPLYKKLGVKPQNRLLLIDAPAGWDIDDLPTDVTVVRKKQATSAELARADLVIGFFKTAKQLISQGPPLARDLQKESALWIAWPRKAGGHSSDITDQIVRETLLPVGVVDVKVAAIDVDWSGLRFVWRLKNRTK